YSKMMFVYIALAALLAGLVKGTSGFGSSLVALPLLTIFYDTQYVVFIWIYWFSMYRVHLILF
ncbi:MAG: hypothetical protein ACVCEJ_04925, partial [Candidatus Izemoplasmataceae bacterium]